MLYLIAAILFVLGVLFGTHVWLIFQIGAALAIIVLLNSWYVRRYEMGALIFVICGMAFIAGMLVGDLNFLIQKAGVAPDVMSWLTGAFTVD